MLRRRSENMIKNLPSNMSADETTFKMSKDLCSNTLTESGFKHKITFQQQKDIFTVTNKTKLKKKDYMD